MKIVVDVINSLFIISLKSSNSGYKVIVTILDGRPLLNVMENKKIKIAVIVNSLAFGGVEKVMENYLTRLDRRRFDVDIIAQENSLPEHVSYFRSLGFKVLLVPHKKHLYRYLKAIQQICAREHYSIVHTNMSYTNFFVLWAAKKSGVNLRINHYHNIFHDTGLKKIVRNYCNKLCDRYATINIFCSDDVKKYFGPTKNPGVVLHNGIDLNLFRFSKELRRKGRLQYGIPDDAIVLGNVGRMCAQKKQAFLIDVFFEYHRSNPNSYLLLVGEGPLRIDLVKQIGRLKLDSFVIFTGAVEHPEVFYHMMDVFCLTSLYEGLPVVGLEAQANGLPCLFSDKISQETKVLNSTKFLSISAGPNIWVKEVNIVGLEERQSAYFTFVGSKFDIQHTSDELQRIYEIE